jgi:peptidyl-prolyl cis-trans isomerase SurA
MQTRSLLAAAALALAWVGGPAASTEQLIDGIAAQVGSRVVLISDVLRAIAPQETMMRENGAPEQEIAKLRAEALEGLIEARLIEGIVAQLELYAKDEEIDATIQTIADENGLTLEQLYASVVFHGMTREEYREQIKGDLERRNVVNGMVGADVEIEDRDLKALYDERFADMPEKSDQVHVRQILVSFGQHTSRDVEEATDQIEQVRQRLLGGEEFAALAREVSEVAPNHGGDIGWLPTDQLASWMSQALEGLGPGDVSQPLLLPFGASLLQLVERRELERLSFEQARPVLQQEIWNVKLEEAYREWMEELRSRTYIDRRGHFADAARFGVSTFGVEPDPQPEGP